MSITGESEPRPPDWVRKQVDKIDETGDTGSVDIRGRSVVLLSMIGGKSGKLRKVPLMRVEHDGVYAAVASLGGAPQHPVWYYNLLANPDIDLQDGTTTTPRRARLVTDDAERSAWWERAVAAYPDYADYQNKTDRVIPVFVLEPR